MQLRAYSKDVKKHEGNGGWLKGTWEDPISIHINYGKRETHAQLFLRVEPLSVKSVEGRRETRHVPIDS